MQYQKVIEQLGYSPKEAKVYLASLALGEAHISDIAAKVKMPRSSVQAIVDRLHDDGLMNFYVMRRYKYWVAEHPERLLHSLEQRRQLVSEALPKLVEMRQQSRKARTAKYATNKDLGPVRAIADEATHAVLITDEETKILYVNGVWEKLFGYSLSEIYGKTPRVCSSGDTPREVYAKMWQTLNEGGMFQTDEVVDQRKDGSTFRLHTTIFPIRHQGRLLYVQILDGIDADKKGSSALRAGVLGAIVTTAAVLSSVIVEVSPATTGLF